MIALKHFFETERREKGWHFWFLWVLATNIGFFPGLALGNYLMNLVAWGISEAAIDAAVFILFTSLAHFVVLRRHVPDKGEWMLSSTLGWTLGIALMTPLVQVAAPWLEPGTPNHTMTLGFLAGLVHQTTRFAPCKKFGVGRHVLVARRWLKKGLLVCTP